MTDREYKRSVRALNKTKCLTPQCTGTYHIKKYAENYDFVVCGEKITLPVKREELVCDQCKYTCVVEAAYQKGWSVARDQYFRNQFQNVIANLSDYEIDNFKAVVQAFLAQFKRPKRPRHLEELSWWLARKDAARDRA